MINSVQSRSFYDRCARGSHHWRSILPGTDALHPAEIFARYQIDHGILGDMPQQVQFTIAQKTTQYDGGDVSYLVS